MQGAEPSRLTPAAFDRFQPGGAGSEMRVVAKTQGRDQETSGRCSRGGPQRSRPNPPVTYEGRAHSPLAALFTIGVTQVRRSDPSTHETGGTVFLAG